MESPTWKSSMGNFLYANFYLIRYKHNSQMLWWKTIPNNLLKISYSLNIHMKMFEYLFCLFIAYWSFNKHIYGILFLNFLMICSLTMQGTNKYIIFSKRTLKLDSIPIHILHVQICYYAKDITTSWYSKFKVRCKHDQLHNSITLHRFKWKS